MRKFTCPHCRFKLEVPAFPYRCKCGYRFTSKKDPGTREPDPPWRRPTEPTSLLQESEREELFPGESDPTLLGNRIAALTKAIGIPPCGGCGKRQAWLNKAHEWLRGVRS